MYGVIYFINGCLLNMPESAFRELANANKSDLKPEFMLMLILVLEACNA